MDDLKEIMDGIKKTSEMYATGLEPDGDWRPMLFVVKGDQITMIGFEMPEEDWQKEKLFMTLLPNLIHEKFGDPDAVIMLVSSWYATNWDEDGPRPRDLPDRKEALLLQGISKDKELTYMGEIKRSESHPELDWIIESESGEYAGRLVGGLRRAVWT